MNGQPKALWLAAVLEDKSTVSSVNEEAAAELRRQHEAIKRLREEIERLRADAERYRWLKVRVEDYDGHACFPEVLYPAPIPDRSPFDAVDAAIDEAMKEAALRREDTNVHG